MSPPEVWGPAVWTLFHTLGEKINEEAYPYVSNELFKLIVRICKFLPCPECSTDASNFLAKIKISELKTKTDFKNTFYLFHNVSQILIMNIVYDSVIFRDSKNRFQRTFFQK
jgi:hypothetical protein